jgi:hypothetical protein
MYDSSTDRRVRVKIVLITENAKPALQSIILQAITLQATHPMAKCRICR